MAQRLQSSRSTTTERTTTMTTRFHHLSIVFALSAALALPLLADDAFATQNGADVRESQMATPVEAALSTPQTQNNKTNRAATGMLIAN